MFCVLGAILDVVSLLPVHWALDLLVVPAFKGNELAELLDSLLDVNIQLLNGGCHDVVGNNGTGPPSLLLLLLLDHRETVGLFIRQ